MPILEALFKKQFWIVHAAGLAAVAYLAAQGATHSVGQIIESSLAEQAAKSKGKRKFAPTSSGEMRNFQDASEQNIFDGKREEPVDLGGGPQACRTNAECPDGSVCQKNPDETEGAPPKVCQADTEVPPGEVDCSASPTSTTSLQLVGSAVFERQEDSLASIIDTSQGKKADAVIYSVNECIDVPEAPEGDVEHEANFLSKAPPCRELPGGHRLVQIGIDQVCIVNTEENRYELVTLEEPPKGAPKVAAAPKKGKASKGKNKFTDEIAEGITKTGPNSYEVKQESVNSALGNLSKLATQARIVPAFEGGESIGFKLFSIRPGSLYSKIGIQNGDVIQAVNGYDLNSPDKALELYQKLKDGKEFSVDIKRRGKPVTLDYRIAQ